MNCSKCSDQSVDRTGLIFDGWLNKEGELNHSVDVSQRGELFKVLWAVRVENSPFMCIYVKRASCFQKLKKKMQRGEKAQNKNMLLWLSNSVTNVWSRVTWPTPKMLALSKRNI